MKLNLKLLGDLQVYDIPYLSLYIDEATRSFYLAFLIDYCRGMSADYAVTPVSAHNVIDYLNQKITLRDLFCASSKIFFWHKLRGQAGDLSLSHNFMLKDKIENSKYNPHLCENEELILDYLQGI